MYSMTFTASDTTASMELILANGRKARKPRFEYVGRDADNHSIFSVSHVSQIMGVQEYDEHGNENGWN